MKNHQDSDSVVQTKSPVQDSLRDDASDKLDIPGVVPDVVQPIDSKAETRLCLKFDVRILPVLAVMCMLTIRVPNNHIRIETDTV